MSLLAPLAAAPRFVRAPPALVEPVPPLPTDRAVPSVNEPVILPLPLMVTVVPLSEIIESPMVWAPVNLASALVVPPGVVTPPPTPVQLPTVVQMLYVPAAAVCNWYVTLA